jgi:AraC-like DNA-binding protein
MITNYFIHPHIGLSPYIDSYVLSTSANNSINFKSHWAATNETSLVFFLSDKPKHTHFQSKADLNNKSTCLNGLLTGYNGTVHFNGIYDTFIIYFRVNGLSKIFGLPMIEVTDKFFLADEILGKDVRFFYEQLLNAKNIQEMADFADSFLLNFLNRQTKKHAFFDGISVIAKGLYNTTNLLSVAEYAYNANMSIRNFERRFTEQAGVSPKLYCRLMRFNEALKIKTAIPSKNWTAIAHECGYFDQMHLIKDFKQFSGLKPTDFFQKSLETNMPKEELRFVNRTSF